MSDLVYAYSISEIIISAASAYFSFEVLRISLTSLFLILVYRSEFVSAPINSFVAMSKAINDN